MSATQTNPDLARKAGVVRRWLGTLRKARWPMRLGYALNRLPRALKLLEARTWRKWLVQYYYGDTDYAPPPTMITLRMTNNCNLRCKQCAQWGEHGAFVRPGRTPFPREMSTADWKAFIARVARFCPHLYFFGGEPLLRKDCLELVRFASSRNVAAGLNTNGVLLKGKGKAVVAAGLDYLIVSLDGPREVNNLIRLGARDVYQAVVEGVEELLHARRLRRSPFPVVEMLMTLTVDNQAYIAETARLAHSLGVDYFAVNLGIFTTPELARESARQFREEFGVEAHFHTAFVRDTSAMDLESIARQIEEVKRLWGGRYKQYPPLKVDLFTYYRKPAETLVRKPCYVPWKVMQVMADGEIAYCEDFADLQAGNVREHHPLALWNNRVSRAYRRRIRTRGIFPAETRCCGYYLQ